MAAKRPRRGRPGPDVLVEGDTGPRQPQGGARVREVFRESGDLASREFGVPQADVPGGLKSDIKLGFGIGIGLVLLGFTLMILQFILGKVKG